MLEKVGVDAYFAIDYSAHSIQITGYNPLLANQVINIEPLSDQSMPEESTKDILVQEA